MSATSMLLDYPWRDRHHRAEAVCERCQGPRLIEMTTPLRIDGRDHRSTRVATTRTG